MNVIDQTTGNRTGKRKTKRTEIVNQLLLENSYLAFPFFFSFLIHFCGRAETGNETRRLQSRTHPFFLHSAMQQRRQTRSMFDVKRAHTGRSVNRIRRQADEIERIATNIESFIANKLDRIRVK